jgi:5-(carboxyamino)imidazole ribonucleotide synthase
MTTSLCDPDLGVRSRTASAVVGMVGGGQLARMTHQAAIALGVELVVLCPDPGDPAVSAGARHLEGDPDDEAALRALAERCDVVTLDHELVPTAHLESLAAEGHRVRPGPVALSMAQDKGRARQALGRAGFPVPAWELVDAGDRSAVDAFASRHGWPLVLKAPTGGYDGRGVSVVEGPAELPEARPGEQWLLEEWVPIGCELAVLVARRPSGGHVTYPVVETTQRDGICHELVMPAGLPPELERRVTAMAVSIADGIDAVGILAVELFLATDGRLLVNELATRPHNSGHATIDACVTSQFENHLRAVLDWPLGDTSAHRSAAMVNLLGPDEGFEAAGVRRALADPSARLHLYGKASVPGRKIGHVTALGEKPTEALERARGAARAVLTA